MANALDIISTAYAQIGKPYAWGHEGPGDFDCSGLMVYVFGAHGITLPRTAAEQQKATKRIDNQGINGPKYGDLVFYGDPAHHVGLYAGAGYMVDAPDVGQNVRVEKVSNPTNYGRVSGVTGQPKLDTSSAGAPPLVVNPVDVAEAIPGVSTVVDWTKELAKLGAALLNPATWLRVGEVILGVALVAVGTAKLTNAIPLATKISKVVR